MMPDVRGDDSPHRGAPEATPAVFPSLPTVISPHMIGFQNHSNTCYLNASLQSLFGLPMLVTDAVNLKYAVDQSSWSMSMGRSQEMDRNEDNEQQVKLVIPFLDITQAREYGEVDNVTRNIDLLKTELEEVDQQFIGKKMQDANEFLCRLMDSIKDNIDKLFQDVKLDIPNFINSNFLSEREETFECLKCKNKESNRHSDLNFYCTLASSPKATALGGEERHVSLQKLVDKTFETEEVRERRCDRKNCGHNMALTTTRLVRMPRVLVLFLKRYEYDQGERSRKISRPVSLPAKLNLTKYVADHVELPNCQVVERLYLREPTTPHPTLSLNSRKRSRVESDDDNDNLSLKVQGVDRLDVGLPEHDYRLVSVVSHYGNTTSSGHYVADVYSFDQGSWFRYSDTVVTPINEFMVRNESNNTKNGYVFMYVQEALAKQYDTTNK